MWTGFGRNAQNTFGDTTHLLSTIFVVLSKGEHGRD